MFAEKIKQVRKALKKTQKELSVDIDIPERTVASYETGREPSMIFLARMCGKYNLNANWFVSNKGAMFNDVNSTVGSRIADIQEDNNISSYKYAEMLDIPESELIDIVNDKKEPDMRVLKNLKKHFGVSIDYILYGE